MYTLHMVGAFVRLLVLTAFLLNLSAQSRTPVLVELFTSEGCSSCPPADRMLEQLDSKVIVLSEHVTYWNQGGWKDPFSSAEMTARQAVYGRIFTLESVYTPEMVVDGETQFNGSDARKATEALQKAAQKKKADVKIGRSEGGLRIEVENAPASAPVYLALAEDSGASEVAAGENQGRHLHHVAVVRSIQKIGAVKRGVPFTKVMELPRATNSQRIVVFVQESGQGRVSGVAMLPPAS